MIAARLRRLSVAFLAILGLAASGCRTAGVNPRPIASTDAAPTRTIAKAEDLLADHNRNAARIESLEAAPQIHVAVNGRTRYVSGKLFMERPRNFNLRLRAAMAMVDVANIGSNDQEFWVWGKDDRDPAVYYCNYDENGVSPLATSLQPDWIVQAMGLRVVPEDELQNTKVERGAEPDTLLLTYIEKTSRGDSLRRDTILQESTGRIREQRILTADGSRLIASAKTNGFNDWPVPGDENSNVYLPAILRIEWAQEKMTLDVALKAVEVNKKFGNRASELFVEPKMEGIARKNLAKLAAQQPEHIPGETNVDARHVARPSASRPAQSADNSGRARHSEHDRVGQQPKLIARAAHRRAHSDGAGLVTNVRPGVVIRAWRQLMDPGIELQLRAARRPEAIVCRQRSD